MDKIKNLLNPGSKKDDEVMYGSGKSDDPVQSGQVGSGNPLTSNKTGDDTGPASAFSGYGNTPVPGANRADIDQPYYEGTQSSTTGTTGTTSHSTDPSSTSRMPGTFDDDTTTTASVKSGVIGQPQEGSGLTDSGAVGSSTNKPLPLEPESAGIGRTGTSGVGPHDSSLANKADPRVDSDLDGSRGLDSDTRGTGSGLTGSSLPDRSVGSSGYGNDRTAGSTNLGYDSALGAGAGAVGSGVAAHHHQREGQEIGGDSGRSFPLSGGSATGTSSTNEPGLGSTSNGFGSGTEPTTGSSHQGNLARDVPIAGAYNEESWKHDHSAQGHEYGGDPCSGPEAATSGGPHFTRGPHALDTANRLDPHVAGGPIESIATGTGLTTGTDLGSSTTDTGLSSTSGPGLDSSSSNDHHLGRDAGLAGGAGAAGLGGYQSTRDGSSTTTTGPHSSDLMNKADPRVDSDASGQHGTSSVGVGSGMSGSSSTTAGPHSSNLANKTDPRVDSDLSGNRGVTTVGPASGVVGSPADGTALPSDNLVSGQTTGRDHHLGRDAGLVGAGAAGFGAYEAGKHHGSPGATSSTATSDPNNSADYDPRIDSTSRARTGLGGTSAISPTTRSETTDTTGRDHHVGRDAGLAGSGGMAAYEGQKHLGGSTSESSQPTQPSTGASPATGALYDSGNGPTTGTDPATTGISEAGTDHHYGRDAAIGAGAAGLAGTAYEAQKRHREPTSATSSSAYDTREPTSTTGTGAYDASKPTGATGTSAYDTRQTHTGRDAALAGGAGIGAGAVAGEELSEKDLKHQQHEMEKEQKAHQKELEKEQKAHQKEVEKEHKAEQKAHDKEVAHEQKHHQHELEKAEKARQHEAEKAEKARLHEAEKAEKAHQKELEKAEKKHEKELSKEEKDHHEKKKHGGILGLFHREKPDDELKKEELQRKGEYQEPDISRDGAAGSIQNPELTHGPRDTTTTGTHNSNLSAFEQEKRAGELEGMSEAEKMQHARQHDRNRLHKDPPPGYIEKKMEEQGVGSTGAAGRETLPDGRVIEPHTGLPMDLSKDTSGGRGGTDDTPVSGYHAH